jgi:hypothetical protein
MAPLPIPSSSEENALSDLALEWARHLSVEEVARLLERTTWRLIETAPRDGTPLIGWDIDPTTNPTGTWVVAHWEAAPTSQDPAGGGWVVVTGFCSHVLSHWMPVPPQPPRMED